MTVSWAGPCSCALAPGLSSVSSELLAQASRSPALSSASFGVSSSFSSGGRVCFVSFVVFAFFAGAPTSAMVLLGILRPGVTLHGFGVFMLDQTWERVCRFSVRGLYFLCVASFSY